MCTTAFYRPRPPVLTTHGFLVRGCTEPQHLASTRKSHNKKGPMASWSTKCKCLRKGNWKCISLSTLPFHLHFHELWFSPGRCIWWPNWQQVCPFVLKRGERRREWRMSCNFIVIIYHRKWDARVCELASAKLRLEFRKLFQWPLFAMDYLLLKVKKTTITTTTIQKANIMKDELFSFYVLVFFMNFLGSHKRDFKPFK